jgi:Xaa-Pro aminopeptidase
MTSQHKERVISLRAELSKYGLGGYIIPRSDEHLGEYVPDSAARLAFISGFTGSAGLAIVLADRAAVFSDGRYTLQLQSETDGAVWERRHILEEPPEAWLKTNAPGQKIGYDPMLVSAAFLKRFEGCDLLAITTNLVDAVWTDRPAPPMAPMIVHELEFSGEESTAKRERLAADLRAAGQDAALLTDPASLAWLFNIRGTDVEFTPIALGFAILYADATAKIFMATDKAPAAIRGHLGDHVTISGREEMSVALAGLTGKVVRYDGDAMPVWFKTTLEIAGASVAPGNDPVALPRACKNATEQAGSRSAHVRDGVAMARFLALLSKTAPAGCETELSAAARLLAFRAMDARFKGESFPAISASGEHGAIIHYRVTPESNRPIKANEVYLIDSGAQYLDGTTDITRTVWTGPKAAPADIKEQFTRVLIGHIMLAEAVFPDGVAGVHLDALARNALWQAGLDYDHGTGHGVGSYLSVHEGPAGISRMAKPVALQPGMILSNEPGYYQQGAYGIRLENLVLVQPAQLPRAKRKFLHFETLTLAPFDRTLIEPEIFPLSAVNWLNTYHARVRLILSAHLDPVQDADTLIWLADATRPL